MNTISRPEKISQKEFESLVSDQDGFRKGRRILFFGWNEETRRWKYRIPMIGPKKLCLKKAYELLFLEQIEEERARWIEEGEFKFPLSFNFANALDVKEYYHL